MSKLAIPDDSVVGTNIKSACEIIARQLGMPKPYIHPWPPTSLNLPNEIVCRVKGVNYTFTRPDDLTYLAEYIPTYDEANVDFRHEESGGFLRLTFRREDGDVVVLSGMEYHPYTAKVPSAP